MNKLNYSNANIKEFARFVKEKNKKIILFGSGTVCKTFIPYLVEKYKLTDRLLYIVDNNKAKQGGYININAKFISIVGPDIFTTFEGNYCVLITNGDFIGVVSQLNEIDKLDNVECFIAAYMQLEKEYEDSNYIFKDTIEPVIPKIIHYCWFSGRPMPENLNKCVDSWKEFCPDYEIIKWDESNFDIKKYKYTDEAHKAGKWGFIPDIVRLEKLYEIGGFYFDTDVKIIKNLEALRYQKSFCGRERQGHVNFGGGSGAVKGSSVIKEILDFRKDVPFLMDNGLYNTEASGYYETYPLMKRGLEIEDINQSLSGINVYASEFFSPYNFISGEDVRSDNTFSVHFFSGSWIDNGDDLRAKTRAAYQDFKEKMTLL